MSCYVVLQSHAFVWSLNTCRRQVEFTIENDELYFLEARVAKRSPQAAVKIAIHMVTRAVW